MNKIKVPILKKTYFQLHLGLGRAAQLELKTALTNLRKLFIINFDAVARGQH